MVIKPTKKEKLRTTPLKSGGFWVHDRWYIKLFTQDFEVLIMQRTKHAKNVNF